MKISLSFGSFDLQSFNLPPNAAISFSLCLITLSLAFFAASLACEAVIAFSTIILASLGFSIKYLSNPSAKILYSESTLWNVTRSKENSYAGALRSWSKHLAAGLENREVTGELPAITQIHRFPHLLNTNTLYFDGHVGRRSIKEVESYASYWVDGDD